ncbi:MAG: hypothetical protein JWO85_2576 [Candidatus Eremiobacteraeota bacterium]|nr:hypothetical protein [Candidatus Eremiobacteraeota bacterium]
MKKLIAGLGGLVFASVLAACGGGGSSAVPGPVATATPIAYSARIVQVGGAGFKQGASSLRFVRDVATPPPVIIDAPEATGRFTSAFDTTATAQVVIAPSPAPSQTPVVAWSDPSAAPITLSPLGIPDPTRIVVFPTSLAPFTSSLTATVTAPAALTATAAVVQLPRGILGCLGAAYLNVSGVVASDYRGGITMTGGAAPTAASRVSADAMMVGPYCAGEYTDNSVTVPTLVFPYGASLVSMLAKGLYDVRLSDLTATGPTSIAPNNLTVNNAGSIIVFKTQSGQVFAWWISNVEPGAAPVAPNNAADVTGPLLQVTT